MNQTNLDYLYQILPAGSDRSVPSARSDSGGFGFGEHLSQAAASVLDVVPPAKREPLPPSKPTSNGRRDSSGYSSNSSSSAPRPADTQASRSAKPEESTNSAAANDAAAAEEQDVAPRRSEKSPDDDADDDQHAEDQAPVAATAAQVPSTKPARPTHKSDGDGVQETKAKIETAVDAKQKSGDKTAKDVKMGDDAQNKASHHAAADATALKAKQEKTGETQSGDPTEARNADGKKTEKTSGQHERAHTEKSSKEVAAKTATLDNSKATETASAKEAAEASDGEFAQDKPANTKATKVALAEKKDDAAGDDASVADDGKASVENSRANAPPVNTSPTSAIANNIATATTLAEGEKSKGDGDSAVKPVTAKPESAVGPLGRALRSTTDVTRNTGTSNTQESPQVDPTRFVGRVAKAFQTANERGGIVQIRLAPPELGSLKIQMTVKDGVMSANLEADNANARRLLLDHLPTLRDRLAEQNIRVDRFDVDVRQENNGGQANPRGSNQNPYQQQADQSDNRRSAQRSSGANNAAAASAATPVAVSRISSTEINLVV